MLQYNLYRGYFPRLNLVPLSAPSNASNHAPKTPSAEKQKSSPMKVFLNGMRVRSKISMSVSRYRNLVCARYTLPFGRRVLVNKIQIVCGVRRRVSAGLKFEWFRWQGLGLLISGLGIDDFF